MRTESLKMQLDYSQDKLVSKINKFIRVSHEEKTKISVLFKINDHRRNKKFKINSKKIGFINLQENKKVLKNDWKSENIEKLVHKICNNIF